MARKEPKPETPIMAAMAAAKVVMERLPEDCEFALSIIGGEDSEALLAIFTKDSKHYYYVTTDYHIAPQEMAMVKFKRGMLQVQIFPPGLYE